MKRTGSTWMYNAVRIFCEESGLGAVWTGTYEDWQQQRHVADCARFCIIKSHRYLPTIAKTSQVFTSFRPLEEFRISYERFVGEPCTDEELTKYLLWLLKWEKVSVFRMWYPAFVENPRMMLKIIASHLAFEPYINAASARLNAIVPPILGYDAETALFANHCTTGNWVKI